MNESTSKLPLFPRPAPEVAAVLTEPRANRLLRAMLTVVALVVIAPVPAKAAERDPRIVECEAKWGKLIENGQKEGNEKKVAFSTKKKLACAEDMAELIQVEKQAEVSKKSLNETKQIGKYLDILALDRPKISSYLKGEGNLSKEEAGRMLREYEHAVDELLKHPDFKAKTYETLSIHKQFIEMSKKKIGQ